MDESLPKDMPTFTKTELLQDRELNEQLPSVKYTNVLSDEFLARIAQIEIVSEPWFSQANCKNQQKIMYDHYGEKKQEKIRREIQAKEICRQCVVIETCLDVAINNHERGAVWGGLNDEERTKLKKAKKAS